SGTLVPGGFALYGMTSFGGANGDGVIFLVPVAGGSAITLFSFDGAAHGASPSGNSLILSGSTLYGMTEFGGAHGEGVIFSIPVGGGTPTTLFDFDNTHGAFPRGDLTLSKDGSTLYGMAGHGGANNDGVIFSIPVTGGTPTTLFSFD